MDLDTYFEQAEGTGVLATADSRGRTDAAIYSKPHFFGDNKVGFIMADRLTHKNLQSNPHASYLFLEAGGKYQGKRLVLKKVRETDNIPAVEVLRRNPKCPTKDFKSFLVVFQVEKVRPLIGG